MFRIRGLFPSTKYHLHVKLADGGDRIARAAPNLIPITIGHADIHNISFVIFRHSRFELSGAVDTDPKFLPTLRVI